ncbi:MAG: CaiB/BaiF CoA-transferase family protein [Alphaproteobacteria bacterium]|jgi:alpha-methylacyl-CoA racemase|nr:CaiB/BaiF CoA-transferase family protein [Alphaproteobacteria bacterium]MDP6812876.1 CaiB/BaiF CoA-transferase family protein [Alphaproteobacteria bacterium]
MGPLAGFKIIEIAGIGPGPFCAMLLSDMGAEVIRVDRVEPADLGVQREPRHQVLHRGRRSLAVDLKQPKGAETVLRLVEGADALIEGFRPGVAERLGIGPEVCLERNPRLVYGRMTGWGQDGPLAMAAGHDINYVALSGALHAIGPKDGPPVPPLNLIGDFGGGGMLLGFGVVTALLETSRSGKGQVVDAAMVDGAALLLSSIYGLHGTGGWSDRRGSNVLDGGAHNYGTYETADGKYVAVGSLEPKFHQLLFELAGLNETVPDRSDSVAWPVMKEKLATLFKQKTRDEWCRIMEGSDVCFAPVLSMAEAPSHPHARARDAFVEIGGITQPAPAPRFDRTPPEVQGEPPIPGEHSEQILADWGFDAGAIAELRGEGVIA